MEPVRDTALCLRAGAYLLTADVDHAAALFVESSAAAVNANADVIVLSTAELAPLAVDRRRWPEATSHVETALSAIEVHRMHDYAICVLAFAAAARLAVNRGNLQEARRDLRWAMRARPSVDDSAAVPRRAGATVTRQNVLRDR